MNAKTLLMLPARGWHSSMARLRGFLDARTRRERLGIVIALVALIAALEAVQIARALRSSPTAEHILQPQNILNDGTEQE